MRVELRRLLGAAYDEDSDEEVRNRARRFVPDLVEGIRAVELPPDVFADLFSAPGLDRTEPWLDRDSLLVFLVSAFATGVPGARRTLTELLARPSEFPPRLVGAVTSQLSQQVEERPELREVAFDFSLATSEPKPLLRLLASLAPPAPDFLVGRSEELKAFLERLLANRNWGLVRRDAYEVWRESSRSSPDFGRMARTSGKTLYRRCSRRSPTFRTRRLSWTTLSGPRWRRGPTRPASAS